MSVEPEGTEPEEVDLDLDLIGDQLRDEMVGDPTRVRIDGVVIYIKHAAAWPSSAMRAAGIGNWEEWAEEVIPDKEQFGHWLDANLENFQIEAIFQECGRKARINMGKSVVRGGSRKRTRRR